MNTTTLVVQLTPREANAAFLLASGGELPSRLLGLKDRVIDILMAASKEGDAVMRLEATQPAVDASDTASDSKKRTTDWLTTASGLLANTERGLVEAKRRHTEDQLAVGHCMMMQREADGVSLRELSMQMGVPMRYVSDLEGGQRTWSPITLADYCHALHSVKGAKGGQS